MGAENRKRGEEKRTNGAENRKRGEENRKKGEENRKRGEENRKMGAENRNCTLGPPYLCPSFFYLQVLCETSSGLIKQLASENP